MNPFGPVFQKELLELSRRRTTYLFRALAAMGLLLVILIFANDTGRFDNLSRVRLQAAIGANIYANWVFYQFWIVCGIIPLLVCGLVASERESGSLELLFTTHLSDREILLGKLASRLFFVLLLVFSALPALVILGLLGGIDFERLAKCTLLTLGSATLVAAAGLYCSTVAKRPWIACLQTYGLFAVLWALVPFAIVVLVEVFILKNGGGTPPRWCFFALMASAPFFGVAIMNEPRAVALIGWLLDWEGILTLVGLWFVIAGGFLFQSVRRLRVGPQRSLLGRFAGLLTRLLAALWKRLVGSDNRLLGRRWRFRLPTFGLGERNPIVWRNLRADVYDPDGNLGRLQFLAWVVAGSMIALIANLPHRNHGDFVQFVVGLVIAFLHIMIAAIASPSIARERQRNSLDPVLLTNLTPMQLVIGTFQGVLWCCLPTFILIAATLTAAVCLGDMTTPFAIEYGVMTTAYSLFLLAAAVFISSAAPQPNIAVAATVAVALAQWFLPIPSGAIFGLQELQLAHSHWDWLSLGEFVFVALPALLFTAAIPLGFLLLGRGRPLTATIILSICVPIAFLLFTPIVQPPAVACFWRWAADLDYNYSTAVANWRRADPGFQWIPFAYLGATVAVLLIAVRRFDRIAGRGCFRRQPLSEKPPFNGRNDPVAALNDPIPRNVPVDTTAVSVD
nr:hypothetical protein Hi04_10k_c2220_00011 [uncultured bacterium]